MLAYKLFRLRKDGSIGPLFINRRQRIPIGKRLRAEKHRTKGFAFRPGWHCCKYPVAPHLSKRGRAWFMVKIRGVKVHERPAAQGGTWFTAREMTVLCQINAVPFCRPK